MSAKTIALVTPRTLSHRTAEETLALGYLASVLRENGYLVTIVDGWLRGISSSEIVNIIAKDVPDIICMSSYRSNLEQAKELLGAITGRFGNIPTICGGYGPTFHDKDFLDAGFSVVVRGEAEHMIVSLIDEIVSHRSLSSVPGITFNNCNATIRTKRVESIRNIDSIPFPARDEIGFAIKRKNPVHVCTSRGCEAHCSFCSIFAFASGASKMHRWRGRVVQNIIDELRYLYEEFGVTHIKFVDDSFLEPPRDSHWVAEFVEALLRHNLPLRFRTQVRADRLNDDIVRGLKQAGWFATSVGIENASASALKRMGKTSSSEDNWKALELLRRHGIYVQMGMILFDDATTIDELETNYRFLVHHDWVVTKGIFSEMFAATGTLYTERLSRDGLLVTNKEQNHSYLVRDIRAMRVYQMLKAWHKSHASLYDWVIDPITAPKVLPDEGYVCVHEICKEIITCDTQMFRRVLDHVTSSAPESDVDVVTSAITEQSRFYACIQSQIQEIYDCYDLVYDGVPNQFLN
ncbi:MAG: radical SAM protein [Candidatus Paceibacterota bacterium]|jgi:hypothetical protein